MPTLPADFTIRRARESDLPEMTRINFAAFPDLPMSLEERFDHLRNDAVIPFEDNWVCEYKGRMVGLFAIYDFRMIRGYSIIPTGGIGRVAVAPEARRLKVAYWMMARAVQIMAQNSVPLSLLHPVSHAFYRSLGWGLVSQVKRYRFPSGSLPDSPERRYVKPSLVIEEQEEVMACYRRFALERNGLIDRDEPYWFERSFKNNLCYSYRNPETEDVEGYVIYKYSAKEMKVLELIWTTKRAFQGLIGFLSAQGDQVETIIYHDQTGLPFNFLMKEPQITGGERNMHLGAEVAHEGAGIMGRIVQLRRALKSVGKFGTGSGIVTLSLTDKLNEENAEPLIVEFDNGSVDFQPQNPATITLSTDISTFSSIFWGALKIQEAIYLGFAELEGKGDATFLGRVFSASKPMCLNYF